MPKYTGCRRFEDGGYIGTKQEFPTKEDFIKAVSEYWDIEPALFASFWHNAVIAVKDAYIRWCVGQCPYNFLIFDGKHRGHWELEYTPGRGRVPVWELE